MIYYSRSGTIAPGKTAAALSFSREIAAHIKGKTGMDIRVGVPVGGNPQRIGWFMNFANLAALEEMQVALTQDQQYMDIVKRSGDNFVAGSFHDEIWRIA